MCKLLGRSLSLQQGMLEVGVRKESAGRQSGKGVSFIAARKIVTSENKFQPSRT